MSPAQLGGIMRKVVRSARQRGDWKGECASVWNNTVTIERPVEEVFEFVSTSENGPTWVSASLRHQRASSGPMRVGTTTEQDVTFL